MKVALAQARLAARHGEVPVGVVMVKGGKIFARARNEIVARHDPSAHAELLAIQRTAKRLRNERLAGCTLYTTLEPCPMCAGAIVLARLDRVVFGTADPKAGAAGSVLNVVRHPELNHRAEVRGSVLAAQCRALLRKFFRRRR